MTAATSPTSRPRSISRRSAGRQPQQGHRRPEQRRRCRWSRVRPSTRAATTISNRDPGGRQPDVRPLARRATTILRSCRRATSRSSRATTATAIRRSSPRAASTAATAPPSRRAASAAVRSSTRAVTATLPTSRSVAPRMPRLSSRAATSTSPTSTRPATTARRRSVEGNSNRAFVEPGRRRQHVFCRPVRQRRRRARHADGRWTEVGCRPNHRLRAAAS